MAEPSLYNLLVLKKGFRVLILLRLLRSDHCFTFEVSSAAMKRKETMTEECSSGRYLDAMIMFTLR